MNKKEQVVSLKINKELKDLGIEQNSLFYWWESDIDGWKLLYDPGTIFRNEGYSAFTVAELGEMLPFNYTALKHISMERWFRVELFMGGYARSIDIGAKTEADARGKMIIHLIKEGIIKVGEVGK
jgi:hypothetical protein